MAKTIVNGVGTIDKVIDAFLVSRGNDAAAISPHYQALWSDIARLIRSGGKRLRPRFAILSYRMFGGKDVEAILPAAAALELLHMGMLVHDDIIDRDYTRHGVDNVAGSYNKKYRSLVADDTDRLHYAHSAALLAGDLLLSESYQLMAESRIDASKVLAIQKLLGRSIFEATGGELLDTESAFRSDDRASPELVARYKTASYTLILPMLVGAELAGVSKSDQKKVRAFGSNLGIAFQLRDDIIGVFGDETQTGKSTTSDIREGKYTYMVEQFYVVANKVQQMEFNRYFGNQSIDDAEAARARELLQVSGAREKTELAIADCEVKARDALTGLTIDSEYLEQLNELIRVATKRGK